MFRRSLVSRSVSPAFFTTQMKSRGCSKYFGVPDSVLKDLVGYLVDSSSCSASSSAADLSNLIAANEGNAVALAAGYHLAHAARGGEDTRGSSVRKFTAAAGEGPTPSTTELLNNKNKYPCVYLQNSGFGNAVNPLLSLTHEQVYQVPMILLVGWRGDPTPGAKKDEPQHFAQGRLMEECFASCEIPHQVFGPEHTDEDLCGILDIAFDHLARKKTPYALLVQNDAFSKYLPDNNTTASPHSKAPPSTLTSPEHSLYTPPPLTMLREEALEIILSMLSPEDIVVSSTGNTSREIFEIRSRKGQGHHQDFLTVGCMGHCSSIAAGIALEKPHRTVYAIDGDGAALMHMGSLAVNGGLLRTTTTSQAFSSSAEGRDDDAGGSHNKSKISSRSKALPNLKHILLNNGCHESTGAGPTVALDVSLSGVARECGYHVPCPAVRDLDSLRSGMSKLQNKRSAADAPAFLEVLLKKGCRPDLGRPTRTPMQNKTDFVQFLQANCPLSSLPSPIKK